MDFVISQKEMDHHSTLRRKMVIKNIHHYIGNFIVNFVVFYTYSSVRKNVYIKAD